MPNRVGIDIVEISRIKLEERFLSRFLHIDELTILNDKEDENAKKEFAAGRWAAKEALFKVVNHNVDFNKINIVNIDGKPTITNEEFNDIEISISHEKKYAVAVAIRF